MKQLHVLEKQFQHYLLKADKDIYQYVVNTHIMPANARLSIYKNAYRLRLLESLSTTYTALQACLGDEAFDILCNNYINYYPSCYRSIRWYGDQLANYIAASLNDPHPYLAELARLEWMMTLVFDAPDSDIISFEKVQSIPIDDWDCMQLKFHPSVHQQFFSWNVVPIWQSVMEDIDLPKPACSTDSVPWIFWRHELECQFSSVDQAEAWAIDAALKNITFGEICVGLCRWHSEESAGIYAASLLKGWITAGLISDIMFR